MRLKSSGIVKALIVIAIAITVTVIAQPFTANAQDKPVTITYWELNVPPYVAYIKRRIVRFEANNPDVKVDFFGEISAYRCRRVSGQAHHRRRNKNGA